MYVYIYIYIYIYIFFFFFFSFQNIFPCNSQMQFKGHTGLLQYLLLNHWTSSPASSTPPPPPPPPSLFPLPPRHPENATLLSLSIQSLLSREISVISSMSSSSFTITKIGLWTPILGLTHVKKKKRKEKNTGQQFDKILRLTLLMSFFTCYRGPFSGRVPRHWRTVVQNGP